MNELERQVDDYVESAVMDMVYKACDWGLRHGHDREEIDAVLVRATEGLEDLIGLNIEEYFE